MLEIYKKGSSFLFSLLLLFGVITYIASPEIFYNQMSYGTLLEAIDANLVYSMEVDKEVDYVIVKLKGVSIGDVDVEDSEGIKYLIRSHDVNYLLYKAEKNDIKIIETDHQETSIKKAIPIFTIVVIMICLYILYHRKSKKPMVKAASSTPKQEKIEEQEKIQDPGVTFDDVAALEEEKAELIEIVDFIKEPEKYEKLGAKIPRGVLLSGKTGTGKTLLAKAVAREAGISFIVASGSDFVNRYVGTGADNIRKLFDIAKKEAPCIVFIDEIDAVGGKRSDNTDGGNNERNQTVDQLLVELDGFHARSDIMILASTNHPDILDPALTRPGRFDRTIHIGLPDVQGRKDILRIHSKNKPFFEDVNLEDIAKNTAGFSGAQLENLLNEAAIYAVRKNHNAISKEDIEEAFRKVVVGVKKSGNIMSEEEKKITASHKVGHAIVSLFMSTQPMIKEVSIIPHGRVGGYTWHNMTEDKNYNSKKELLEGLTVLMAGRAAERVMIGDISTGASKDIEEATDIATKMISIYGMDEEIGPISFNNIHETYYLSETMLDSIGDKIQQIVKSAEERATVLINENLPLMKEAIQILLEKETLRGEEIKQIYHRYKNVQ